MSLETTLRNEIKIQTVWRDPGVGGRGRGASYRGPVRKRGYLHTPQENCRVARKKKLGSNTHTRTHTLIHTIT